MKRLSLPLIIIPWLCLGSLTLIAQEDRVVVRFAPKPNLTTHLRLTEESEIAVTASGAIPSGIGVGWPVKEFGKLIIAFTQKTGRQDEQGRMEVELTCDEVSGRVSTNSPLTSIDDLIAFSTRLFRH